MKEALKVLADLVADGVIENYAIGGAMGVTFYRKCFAEICVAHGLSCPDKEDAR